MKEKIVLVSIAIAILGFFYMRTLGNRPKYTLLKVGEATVKVEKADTLGKQRQGLSGRTSLGADEGMLFLMAMPDQHTFVMRDMKFPLDIVWIRNGAVVEVSYDVPSPRNNEKPIAVQPTEAADRVLEVNAGWTRLHQVKVGDEVKEIE